MIDKIKVTINGKVKNYTKGITLEEIADEYDEDFKYPILLGRVDGQIQELSYKLHSDCKISFLDLTSPEGNRTHISGITYLLVYAVNSLYGKRTYITVEHSIDKGLYVTTNFKLTREKLKDIKNRMKEISNSNLPITKLTINRLEAIEYFKNIGNIVNADVISYNNDNYITLYRLGNLYDYFYNAMPTSTSRIKDYELTYIDECGLVLRFPTIFIPDKIMPYVSHPNLFKVFKEAHDWAKIMNVENVADLNRIVSRGKISDLIKIDETLQNNRLLSIAKDISEAKNKIKIVLMAGPSSSGKTTTSKKLCLYLNSFGLNPVVISMDDYFLDRKDTPIDKEGNKDYESLKAVDIELFNKQIASLLKGEKIVSPTYNFISGKKEFNKPIELKKRDIILIEGIHALDRGILANISREKKYKIYISALTELKIDYHNRISTTDNRLLRRIIRDSRTRGYPVETSLKNWSQVRIGEEKYIFTCQDEADVTVNSALIYEIGVLRTYVEPLLYGVPISSPYYEEAKRLMRFLSLFLPIPSDDIPEDSILREFIGNSYFESN